MTTYAIVCKRRARCIHIAYLAIRYKTELYQRLKSVAYAADKTIVYVQHLMDCITYSWVTQKSRYEFTRTVRLVASGKAARNKQNIASFNTLRKFEYRFFDKRGSYVAHDEYFGVSARKAKRTLGIIFAIRSRERRY